MDTPIYIFNRDRRDIEVRYARILYNVSPHLLVLRVKLSQHQGTDIQVRYILFLWERTVKDTTEIAYINIC